jgi:hypothetical protein
MPLLPELEILFDLGSTMMSSLRDWRWCFRKSLKARVLDTNQAPFRTDTGP